MKPDAPESPDYVGAAQAQGTANLEAAKQSGIMNNPNVTTPYGTQTTTFDPTNSQPSITQTFSPEQQAIFNEQMKTKLLLGGLGQQGAASLEGVVGKPVDFSGSPAAAQPGAINQNLLNAMMQRPRADYARAQDQSHSDLAAAGIPVGSKAYNTQDELLSRQLTDAQTQAGIAATTSGFEQQQAARNAANQEYLAQRQTPINEISALLSGSQVSNPFSAYNPSANVRPADLVGATTAAGNYGSDLYNAQAGQAGQTSSGLFGLGSAGLMAYGMGAFSDRRLKSKIRRVGTHPLGIGLYSYTIFGRSELGVMAQEVLTVRPEAVGTHPSGYLMVDYGRLA